MVTKLIQKQVGLGSNATFYLNNNTEVTGTLIEMGLEHIVVQVENKQQTILVSMIGSWIVESEGQEQKETEKISIAPSNDLKQQPQTDQSQQEVLEKLIRIEAIFSAKIDSSRIQPIVPAIVLLDSEKPLLRNNRINTGWSKVRSKYDYALKVNEIGDKYGRMQSIVADLEDLLVLAHDAITFNRLLGYFYRFVNKFEEALSCCKAAAINSGESQDWINLASIALENKDNQLACVALEKIWSIISPTATLDNWYVYVSLIQSTRFYPSSEVFINAKTVSRDDWKLIYETSIYLLLKKSSDGEARSAIRNSIDSEDLKEAAIKLLGKLENPNFDEYMRIKRTVEKIPVQIPEKKSVNHINDFQNQLQGTITDYVIGRTYAFIKGDDGTKYFFHLSGVVDNELRDDYQKGKGVQGIEVLFEVRQSAKGYIAVGVRKQRSIEEMYLLAKSYAEKADYPLAIGQMKQVLASDPNYKDSTKLLDQWREYARVTGVPEGSNPFARAKRVQLVEKDLGRAAALFEKAIKDGDNVQSAIKDLVSLWVQMGEYRKAIELLKSNRIRIGDSKFTDNMLITLYYRSGNYDAAISDLEKRLALTNQQSEKAQLSWLLGNNYLKKEVFEKAETYYRKAAEWQPENLEVQRLIAYCLFNQQKFAEAKKILYKLIQELPESQSATSLLKAIEEAEKTGRKSDLTIETTLVSLSGEISEFSKFIISQCAFKGIAPERISEDAESNRVYVGSTRDLKFDIDRLENFSKSLGTRRPFERAEYLLSAAKLVQEEGSDQFYVYLCRSLASRGDAAVVENRPLDSARSFFCEALAVYDAVREQRRDEQDAINAMVRYLYSTLGSAQVPMQPDIPTIDETLEAVLPLHPNQERLFDLIVYLLRHSRFASKRILNRLFSKPTLQVYAFEYLKLRGVLSTSQQGITLEEFVGMWNKLRTLDIDKERLIRDQIKFLGNVELTTASLEDGNDKLKEIEHKIPFDLDKDRVRNFSQILETAVDLRNEDVFEEQERLCQQIITRCEELQIEIGTNPTELCIRDLLGIVKSFENKVKIELSKLYESSVPQISLRMPVDSFVPDDDKTIDAQILIENRRGCSPAESVKLIVVTQDDDLYSLRNELITLPSSLRGNGQQYFRIPIKVTEKALKAQAFSLPVYVQYETRLKDKISTNVENFSLRLYKETEFQAIDNPYARYAESSIVEDPRMFYGREELIENSAKAIINAGKQGKSIVIYGQKRAGKSSILYHLGLRLSENPNLLIVDMKNIASIMDRNSKYAFEYQLLWGILSELNWALEQKSNSSMAPFDFEFPEMNEFYNSPSPLISFKDTIKQFLRKTSQIEALKNMQIVLLIDEFTYIFEEILNKKIEPTFMKTWKALLQEKLFSVVLVGQDVMQKFKQSFPNEFGTTQDERVSYLRYEDAYHLIDEPIRIGGNHGESRFRERAIDRIIELTSGSPYYIQIICNRLVEYMNRKKAIYATEADVETVKNDLISGVNALGLDKFDNLINSGDTSPDAISDEDILKVISSIANNSKHGRCSESSVIVDTDQPISRIIDDLVHRDIIERIDGHFYHIRVGLFKEWLLIHPQI